MPAVATATVSKKRVDVLTRIMPDALRKARIACEYKGMTVVEYVSRVVMEAADRDIKEGHAREYGDKPPRPAK